MARLTKIVTVKVAETTIKPYPYLYDKQTDRLQLGGDIEPGRLHFLPRNLLDGSYTAFVDSTFVSGAGGVIMDRTRKDEWLDSIQVPPPQSEAADSSSLKFYVFNRQQQIGLTFDASAGGAGFPYITLPDQLALRFTNPVLTGDPFDVGETVHVGFSTRTYDGATLTDVRAWARIQEETGIVATIGIDLPVSTIGTPTEVNEQATFTLRFDKRWTRARGVVDDLGRDWIVGGRRASEDRRMYELDCTRRITV